MAWRFTKMHGAGNDFAIIDGRQHLPALDASDIARAGDRHGGIGFDQLISIEPARDSRAAFYYGIWNADGSAAQQCGNGARCVAAWLYRAGALPLDTPVCLQSPSGLVSVRLLEPLRVSVNMGAACLTPASLALDVSAQSERYTLDVDGEAVSFAALSMGNPHAVLLVDDIDDPRWTILAPRLATHPAFAHGCNVGIAQILNRDTLRLRVFERGAGWTLACGSGACAAAVIAQRHADMGTHVKVILPGGTLSVDCAGDEQPVWLTGPASFVYAGEWLDAPG
ncbi:MAG: diaminopimelate epimerase [Xanthomonadales bacterium]|nr:diaminopimelate epimerase [Xanthomonadales bacterium]